MKAIVLSLVAAGLAISLAGCESFQDKKAGVPDILHRSKAKEPEAANPERMAVMWSEAVYTFPGREPTRGFGGRLYFYDEAHQSVPVDGELTVYAYDDSAENTSKVPSRKFVYTPEQFARHYSKTELGHSYSVWIPWDAAGGDQKSITLVPVFRAHEGKIVQAEATKNVLPGNEITSEEAIVESRPPERTRGPFQQAKFANRTTTIKRPSSRPRIEATTIPLSSSLTRQMQTAQPAARTDQVAAAQQPTNHSSSGAQISYGERPAGWSSNKAPSGATPGQQQLTNGNSGGAQISYGERPSGWSSTNTSYGATDAVRLGVSQSSSNNPAQSRRRAFGAPGPLSSAGRFGPPRAPSINGHWSQPQPAHSGPQTPQAPGGQSALPSRVHNPTPPSPAGLQRG